MALASLSNRRKWKLGNGLAENTLVDANCTVTSRQRHYCFLDTHELRIAESRMLHNFMIYNVFPRLISFFKALLGQHFRNLLSSLARPEDDLPARQDKYNM